MNDTYERDRLNIGTKVFYLFGDVGISICVAAVGFFLLFYFTEIPKVNAGVVGTALLLGKLWDAVSDPLFGWISDRTKSRFGRRKVYLYYGSIPLGIAFALLWIMPESLTPGDITLPVSAPTIAWIMAVCFFYFTMITVVGVSYYALTPELTRDYDERTSLTTFRMIGGTVGYMTGAGFPPFVASLFMTERIGWGMMGIMFGAFSVLMLFVTALGVKQRPELEGPPSELPVFKSIFVTFKNKPYLLLMIQGLFTSVAFGLVMSYMAYYLTYQMDIEKQIPIVIVGLLVTIGAFLFFWKWLSDKWGKKGPTYALGLFIAFSAMSMTYFLKPGDYIALYTIIFIAGFGFSAQWVMPWSIIPDVVEYDELITGERREGIFYGVKGLTDKVSTAISLFIGGWVLEIVKYVPDQAQTPKALLGIKLFFGPIPALITFISLPLLIWFPITRASHIKTLELLKEKKGKK